MGLQKKVIIMTSSESDNESDHSNSESDSDVSMTSESEESEYEASTNNVNNNQILNKNDISNNEDNIDEDEGEEDEIIKAIKYEKDKPRDHPPDIITEDHIVDLSFHPHENILAVASVTGDVLIYKYTNELNTRVNTYELHLRGCRDIEFNDDGTILFSAGKDKHIILTDMVTGKLIKYYEDAHDVPLYCISVIDQNLLATGDEDGVIKLWDLRERSNKCILSVKKNEDYISDIITNEEKKLLICSSGDGSLTTIDLINRQFKLQSEEYEEDLTCLGLFRSETKLLAGSSKGKLFLFNWEEFGLHSDEFPGPKTCINSMIPITENIVVTACEDGILRATHLFPHRHLGIVGQHDVNIECVDICSDGTFIASSGMNNDIKFWNIQYFEDISIGSKSKKHTKKKDLKNNLPSSKQKNVADFFADLNN